VQHERFPGGRPS